MMWEMSMMSKRGEAVKQKEKAKREAVEQTGEIENELLELHLLVGSYGSAV